MEPNDSASSVEQTREVGPLTMRAAFRPDSVNVEERTVDLIFTTGARVKRGFWDPHWEELSLDPKHVRMDRLNNGAPLLAAHNAYDLSGVLGVVESARLEKTKGVATVRFARGEDNPEAEKAFRMVKDGILQNVSVGYRVHKLEQTEDGRARDDKTPVLLATDWEPYELSVVPMGADDGAGFRNTDARATNRCTFVVHPQEQEHTMSDKNKTTEIAPAPVAPALGAEGIRAIDAAVAEAEQARVKQSKDAAEAAARAGVEAQKAERARVAEIHQLARTYNLGDEFADKMVRSGAPIGDVNSAVLKALAARSDGESIDGHVRYEAGDDQRDKFVRGGVASILERAGNLQVIEAAKENKRIGHLLKDVASDAGEFRGMRLYDLARTSLERRGVSTKGLHGEALVRRAFEYRDGGMNTSSDFTILLETAVNRSFLGQYALAPVTWPSWCGRKSAQDFRTSTFYRPGTFGTLDSVSESGEIKHKNIPDGAKATLTPATKGNIIGITRRAIVNDDLGAFRDLGPGLGLAAAMTIEGDAYLLLTANSGLGPLQADGQALFHTNRKNIGSTGAMSVTTLDSLRSTMAIQKDVSGNQYLALRPAVLIVPVELSGTAKVFNESAADPTDNKSNGVANRVRGLFREIVDSPRLSASSATRHYAVADPALYPAFAVGFIDGQEAPRIESHDVFGYDGVQMKVVLDYGTAVMDYRPAVTCAGS
jgi:HK97 family phage prohead protease